MDVPSITPTDRAKLSRLDRIREQLSRTQATIQDNEEERIRRAVEEIEARNAATELDKTKYRMALQKQINEHREQQMSLNKQRLDEERDDDRRTLEMGKKVDALFFQGEEARKTRQRDDLKKLADFHTDQANGRIERECAEVEEERGFLQRNLEIEALEETQFQEYAKRVINHMEKTGRNVYPLRKAARSGRGGGNGPVQEKTAVRPNYKTADGTCELPTYKRASTDQTKAAIGIDGVAMQTNKRLGFNFETQKTT